MPIHLRPATARLSLAAALAALAAAAPAGATGSVVVSGQSATIYKFGYSDCTSARTVTFTWDLTNTAYQPGTQTLKLRATRNSSCTADSSGDKTYNVPTTAAQGTSDPVPLQDFLFASATSDGGTASACDSSTSSTSSPGTAYFCVAIYNASTDTTAAPTDFGSQQLNFAMLPPTAPSGVSAEGGDSLLRVYWSAGNAAEAVDTYDLFVVPTGATIDSTTAVAASSTSPGSLVVQSTSGGAALVNGQAYDVRVRATGFGNPSALSDLATATPEPVDDFYRLYRHDGGSAGGGGGCGGSAAGWTGALVALAAGLLARRRRSRAGGALLIALALLSAPAWAGEQPAGPPPGPPLDPANLAAPRPKRPGDAKKSDRAPRSLLFAVKLDKYDPKVDSEAGLGGKTPYFDIFQGRVPWRVQVEGDWSFFHHPLAGSLLVGGTAGFWQNIGKGLYAAGPNAGQRSGDTSLLDVWPLGATVTWRWDALADRTRFFPLVPYAQAGLTAALWVAYAGSGKVANASAPDTGHGSGWSYGYTTALGVSLVLDAIDTQLSNEAYVDLGLQRTSLFLEYGWTRLDGFHSDGVLVLSDRAWRFGLSLEF